MSIVIYIIINIIYPNSTTTVIMNITIMIIIITSIKNAVPIVPML